VLKGLPLAYNKDMQEDKEPIFDTVDTLSISLAVLAELVTTTEFRTEAMLAGTKGDFSTAVDIADYLVRRGVPFRSAHEIVGRLVQYCMSHGKTFEDLSAEELLQFSDKLDAGAVAGAEKSVEARDVTGSTSPARIAEQLAAAKRIVG
ncbi:MAG: argininosuccinate lyase, partial [Armatimonadota bacterium]